MGAVISARCVDLKFRKYMVVQHCGFAHGLFSRESQQAKGPKTLD